jgi:hypothetical protein
MGIGKVGVVNRCQFVVSVEEVGSSWALIPGWMMEEAKMNYRKKDGQERKAGRQE